MHDKHHNMTYHADGLPSLFVKMRVASAGRQWVTEYQLRRLKTQMVVAFIEPVLFVCPYPPQYTPRPIVKLCSK